MLVDDRGKDPTIVLPYLVGRPLPATEVYEAFGYRKSAYYKAVHEGRLVSANNLLRVAKYFGLNPIDLQVRFGLIEPEAVIEYLESKHPPAQPGDRRADDSRPAV